MGKELVSDELWEAIEPLLPPEPPKPKGGRPRVPDRAALAGIVFVLKTGIPWQMLPTELGCGSGMTCWRRLRDWQAAGVWARLHRALLDRLRPGHTIGWCPCCIDSASVPAKGGRGYRTEPDGSGQAGDEAPRPGRRQRRPARPGADVGERPRQHDAGAGARRGAAGAAMRRPPPQASRQAPRGQRV